MRTRGIHLLMVMVSCAASAACVAPAGAPISVGAEGVPDYAGDAHAGMAGPTGTNTGTYLFDESYDFQPGFDLYQQDRRLQDLFDSSGESQLCWPTSLAHRLAEQKLWRNPAFPSLPLVADPLSGDYTPEVRALAQLCHTDHENGTRITDAIACVRSLYQSAGYAHSWAYVIGPAATDSPPGESLSAYQRPVTIEDIRRYASLDYGVIAEVGWYAYDPASGRWNRKDGHYFNIYGYDYLSSWGDGTILLKAVNPNVDYSSAAPSTSFSTVAMTRVQPRTGEQYPPDASYFLQGSGFSGINQRAFLRNLLVFLPEVPQGR